MHTHTCTDTHIHTQTHGHSHTQLTHMHKTNMLALTHIYTHKHAPTDTHTHAHVCWLVGSGCSPAEWYCLVLWFVLQKIYVFHFHLFHLHSWTVEFDTGLHVFMSLVGIYFYKKTKKRLQYFTDAN